MLGAVAVATIIFLETVFFRRTDKQGRTEGYGHRGSSLSPTPVEGERLLSPIGHFTLIYVM